MDAYSKLNCLDRWGQQVRLFCSRIVKMVDPLMAVNERYAISLSCKRILCVRQREVRKAYSRSCKLGFDCVTMKAIFHLPFLKLEINELLSYYASTHHKSLYQYFHVESYIDVNILALKFTCRHKICLRSPVLY